jgi:hypothetical protein
LERHFHDRPMFFSHTSSVADSIVLEKMNVSTFFNQKIGKTHFTPTLLIFLLLFAAKAVVCHSFHDEHDTALSCGHRQARLECTACHPSSLGVCFLPNGLGKSLFRPSSILRQSSIYVLIFQTQTSSIFHRTGKNYGGTMATHPFNCHSKKISYPLVLHCLFFSLLLSSDDACQIF